MRNDLQAYSVEIFSIGDMQFLARKALIRDVFEICPRFRAHSNACRRLLVFTLPQVAEALLHMQVRLGMLKADDVPSLQAPPAPSVVGGAIMLGTGAVLPQLVPVSIGSLLFAVTFRF